MHAVPWQIFRKLDGLVVFIVSVFAYKVVRPHAGFDLLVVLFDHIIFRVLVILYFFASWVPVSSNQNFLVKFWSGT